jgi:predicted SnoaL-like aldol condensation-catalyzing enzyme
MRINTIIACGGMALGLMTAAHAQVPPVAAPDQLALLKSNDPKLAANKKLVFDAWRAIVQAGRVDLAPQYFTENYIQHNPNVATGLAAMIEYMKKTRPVRPIDPMITFPVISIIAEGDLVSMATVTYEDDPDNPGKKYSTTHFDMFRIENGKIAEHWDNLLKSKEALTTNPNVKNKP